MKKIVVGDWIYFVSIIFYLIIWGYIFHFTLLFDLLSYELFDCVKYSICLPVIKELSNPIPFIFMLMFAFTCSYLSIKYLFDVKEKKKKNIN